MQKVCLLEITHSFMKVCFHLCKKKVYTKSYDWEHRSKSYICTSFMTRVFIVTIHLGLN